MTRRGSFGDLPGIWTAISPFFPTRVPESAEVITYEATLRQGLFDTDAVIILACRYDEAGFRKEIDRIGQLSMTIRGGTGETWTNTVRYDETQYSYPAYITIDGFGCTYEYVLADQAENGLVYVFLSYPDIRQIQFREYLKKDLTQYEAESTLTAFSMYNHSFDNGRSFAEFDDWPEK